MQQQPSKAVNLLLWTAQILLGLLFALAGAMKATLPLDQLAQMMAWVPSFPPALVRFVGISDFLGGIGLILPAALRIRPQLTSWAAIGLSVIMVLAAALHASRGEYAGIGVNAVFLLMLLFIAWGRMKIAPIQPKTAAAA
ncbi:MAG: DoxX family protein [Bacteroidia bacterium]|nr:DoxX family protein [Bacteroidia bacterium]